MGSISLPVKSDTAGNSSPPPRHFSVAELPKGKAGETGFAARYTRFAVALRV